MTNKSLKELFKELNKVSKETNAGYNFHFYADNKGNIQVAFYIDSYASYNSRFCVDIVDSKHSKFKSAEGKDNSYIALNTESFSEPILLGDLEVITTYMNVLNNYKDIIFAEMFDYIL